MPVTVVRSERVAALCAGPDVDRHAASGIEVGAAADDGERVALVPRPDAAASSFGGAARVDRDAGVGGRQREAPHVAPVRPDERLHASGLRDAVLRHDAGERERLPAVRVAHLRPRFLDHERRVGRLVGRIRVAERLVRAVLPTALDVGRRDAVPERGRRIALRLDVVDAVAEPLQRRDELVERLLEPRGIRVAVEEEAVGRVAQRGLARRLHVVRAQLLAYEPAVGLRVVGGPGVPHGRRDVEEVPRVDGRRRRVPLDRVEECLVPDPCDRMRPPRSRGVQSSRVVERSDEPPPNEQAATSETSNRSAGGGSHGCVDLENLVRLDVLEHRLLAAGPANTDLGDRARVAEPEVEPGVLGREVARAGVQLTPELPSVCKLHGHLGAGRRALERDLQPTDGAAVLEQDERPAERQDRDVEVAVVVVVGGRAAPRDDPADALHRIAHLPEPALPSFGKQVLEDLDPLGVPPEVRDRDVAVDEHEIEVRVVVEVRPGGAPAGRALEVDPRVRSYVRERRIVGVGRIRPVEGVALAARVRDEDVGAPVGVPVADRHAHAGVRVGHACGGRPLLEAEAEAGRVGGDAAGPGHVLVEAIRVRVVREVNVEITVTLEIGEHDAEAVAEAHDLEPGLAADLAEPSGRPRSGTGGPGAPRRCSGSPASASGIRVASST